MYTVRTRLQNALSTSSPSVRHTHNDNNNNNNIETVGVFDVPGTPITNQSTRQTSREGIHHVAIYVYKIYTINILYTFWVCVCVCVRQRTRVWQRLLYYYYYYYYYENWRPTTAASATESYPFVHVHTILLLLLYRYIIFMRFATDWHVVATVVQWRRRR